jgi:uncharacterized protein YdeI (YjbR/CyaY-like superfamily)
MNNMNPKVDLYLADGCGRCAFYKTPECKVNNWREELETLRSIILDCGLTEDLKWKIPCYTLQNNNIVLLGAFNEYVALSFFKGALLKDTNGILIRQTENVQATRQLRFTDFRQINGMESVIKSYIYEAIDIEKAGLKITLKTTSEFDMPEELQNKLDETETFKTAFYALTQGRQRAYILYFSQPKQSKTRAERVEKLTPQILIGKGLNDDYMAKRKK